MPRRSKSKAPAEELPQGQPATSTEVDRPKVAEGVMATVALSTTLPSGIQPAKNGNAARGPDSDGYVETTYYEKTFYIPVSARALARDYVVETEDRLNHCLGLLLWLKMNRPEADPGKLGRTLNTLKVETEKATRAYSVAERIFLDMSLDLPANNFFSMGIQGFNYQDLVIKIAERTWLAAENAVGPPPHRSPVKITRRLLQRIVRSIAFLDESELTRLKTCLERESLRYIKRCADAPPQGHNGRPGKAPSARPTKAKYHEEPPPVDGQWYGPIEGSREELAYATRARDPRNLTKRPSLWTCKHQRGIYLTWFSVEALWKAADARLKQFRASTNAHEETRARTTSEKTGGQ